MRSPLRLAALVALLCLLPCSVTSAGETPSATSNMYDVYVGTYTRNNGSQGIYRLRFDAEANTLKLTGTTGGVTNPSFLAFGPERQTLYSVSEIAGKDGKPTPGVVAFRIDEASGALERINDQPAGGSGPCHVDVSRDNVLAVANYGGGSVSSYQVAEDGSLSEPVTFVQHEGSSVNPRRQNGPHAHCVNFSPNGKHLMVADLGLDKVLIYKVDAETGAIASAPQPFAKVAPGAGPRHFAFRPDGRFAYVINELASTVTAFKYDADKGTLTELQTIGTLPDSFDGQNTTAEIFTSPDGKFLYGSNRGHDSIAVFRIDESDGTLTFVEHESTGGETPRNFNLDPSGRFLFACNQKTNNIVVLARDAETGELENTGVSVDIPSPVCVIFRPIPASEPAGR